MPLTRSFLVALSLTALVPIIDAAPVDAQTATCRPWCRERSGGGTNCGREDIIEMNRSILWVLSGTLHLFETRIPRFRIGHVRVSHSR